MQTYFMQNTSCNACKTRRNKNRTKQTKLRNKTTVFIKQLLFIQVTEKHRKINLGWRHNKKNKGQGFFSYFTYKLSSYYNTVDTGPSLGFCLDVYKLSVKLKTIAKRKTGWDLTLRVTIV